MVVMEAGFYRKRETTNVEEILDKFVKMAVIN